MKQFLIGTAAVLMMAGAAVADDPAMRGLDLPGEPPGSGATRSEGGNVVFPGGSIDVPNNAVNTNDVKVIPPGGTVSLPFAPMPQARFPGDRPPPGAYGFAPPGGSGY